jgi:Trypsin
MLVKAIRAVSGDQVSHDVGFLNKTNFCRLGPLMMEMEARWTQLGIVSFGNKCGEPGYPGVYTRISEYLDWIKENTRN